MSEPAVADVVEAVAAARGDHECMVTRFRRATWRATIDRTHRLANVLVGRGLGAHRERSELRNHESGQDHLGIYLHNCHEYLESMIGSWMARVAPFNINYRYRAAELAYLLDDAGPAVIVVHSTFTPTLWAALGGASQRPLVIQVPDDSGNPLLPDAVWYDEALAASDADPPPVAPSPDDLYLLYTGGTTGKPKGVLWRNGDALVECFAGIRSATTAADYVTFPRRGPRSLPVPPFMHGAGHWIAMRTLTSGGTVCIQDRPERFDAAEILGTVERERVDFLLIVGDAFAVPLLDELDRHRYDTSSLNVVVSGGAALSAANKQRLVARLPTIMLIDGVGSSEAGGQLTQVSSSGSPRAGRSFATTAGNHILSDDLTRRIDVGSRDVGWLAKTGRLALGYLGDEAKTAAAYPVVDGVRYAVPGDRAAFTADGEIRVLGRDSTTINTGGEKVFAEEVEEALKRHPEVADCLVVGRPSRRWGNEVVGVVATTPGSDVDADGLIDLAGRSLARYKLPKAIVFVDTIARSPAGKPDYGWAASIVGPSA